MLNLLTEEEARAICDEFHEPLFQSMTTAWAEWQKHDQPRVPQAPRRALGAMMQAVGERELRTRLGNHPQIWLSRNKGEERFFLKISEKAVVRIKKLTKAFFISNYPTKTAN